MGVTVLVTVALLFPVRALAVSPARGWGLLWAVPVSTGTEFQLNWIHTVTRRPITETYEVEADGRLHLLEMVFDAYGPNLPAGPEEGTTWRIEDDRWVVTGYSLRPEQLNLGVGPFGHALLVAGRRWDMLAGVGADRLVRLKVGRIPIALILLSEGYQWRNTNRF